MPISSIPADLRNRFHFDERGHACAILQQDYPRQFSEILACLKNFHLSKSDITNPGGGKSKVPQKIDVFLEERGWQERKFQVGISVDGKFTPTPTHKIDNFKDEVGLEVEWNNKTEFYDRDLNNFRLLKELRVLAVGVIVTRLDELQDTFNFLGPKIGKKYGASTTHWGKLIPKVDGGGAGGCPLLLVGLGKACLDFQP